MMGIKEDEIEIETDEDLKRREKNKRFFFETSEYILPKHKDNFHQKISDQRRLELLKEVNAKRSEQTESYINQLRVDAIDEAYKQNIRDYTKE